MIELPYGLYEQSRQLVEAHGGVVLAQDFAGEVTLTARFPVDRLEGFQLALSELSNGGRQAMIVETAMVLMPE
jgi:hypothetical protein